VEADPLAHARDAVPALTPFPRVARRAAVVHGLDLERTG
jgi:hypothetical protein